ncbi:tRNA-splicing endonuclease subunit Sen34 isoform X2 [Phycodurus eques]|uniref:tRNA-splicing endonuclease subunit Sen34 isoform X2 n=1 Tax=Phycodurus eques TaxID=693459 RepID=UPI002ACDDC74|nr:tRNA-splicing endonuclease subunit Sen34 isoform X2 [Phycodurus eques]
MSSSAPNKLNTVIDKYAAEMSAKEAESRMRAVCVSPCDSAPLVWRMEDVAAVRSLGLVGALLGSLPRTPRQNVRMGRPLLLLPVEERLLDRHRATAEAAITQADAGQQVTLFQETLRRSYEEQRVLALRDRKLAMVRALGSSDPVFHSDEVENVTKTQRVAVTHLTRSEGDGEDGRRRRLEALERNFSFPRSAMTVQLSTARAGLAHLLAGGEGAGPTYGTDGHALRRPADPRRDARYRVFADLRGRGFYLTSAGKFGGDFLVYPGEPLRFHAHFIAVCVRADERVSLLDLLAVARLGSNVKKTVLLCSPRDDGVTYSSLQWSGMI